MHVFVYRHTTLFPIQRQPYFTKLSILFKSLFSPQIIVSTFGLLYSKSDRLSEKVTEKVDKKCVCEYNLLTF